MNGRPHHTPLHATTGLALIDRAPVWLSKREAAERVRLSERTLERAIAAGQLPAAGGGRPGTVVRIAEDDLLTWAKQRGREDKS